MKVSLFMLVGMVLIVSCSSGENEASADNGSKGEGAGTQKTPQAIKLPAGSVRVQQAQIMDRNGFGKVMVAATTMIPVGWKTRGGVIWQQNTSGCGPNTPHINWVAVAPDGIGMMSILPDETWSGHNMQVPNMPQTQCPNVQITDTRQFVLSYVQRYRPNARLLDYREDQELTREIQQSLQQVRANMPSTYGGMDIRQWGGAGSALIGYQVNGREVREQIGTAVIFTLTRIPDALSGGTIDMLAIFTLPGFAMRMPDGQLDFKQVEMFRKSGKPDSEWTAKMAQYRARIAAIQRRGAADRAQIRSNSSREIADMQMDSWRRQQAISDRGQRERVEAIRGVETYNDPYNGGTVQLDNTYNNAWQLNDGTYVLTDDQSFNPYAATGQDGQQLKPMR